LVPWIYGSSGTQADNYIGFDCADLVVAGARKAGHSVSYTNVTGLKNTRPAIGAADEPYYLDGGTVKKRSDGNNATFTIGTDINIGDLIIIDWDADGSYTHSTVLYSDDGDSILDGGDTLIYATKTGVFTSSLSSLVDSEDDFVLRVGW